MMGLLALNTVWFLKVAVGYEYKKVEHKLTVSPSQQPHPSRSPDSSSQLAGPLPSPGGGVASSARAIRARGAEEGEAGGGGDEESGPDMPSLEVYARSLAYQPPMPAMPAPFR